MSDIWQSVAELALELHPERLKAFAAKVDTLASVKEFRQLANAFAGVQPDLIARMETAWQADADIGAREIAAGLRAAARTALIQRKRQSVELVWTGPSTGFVAIRHTEQVLLDVIDASQEHLFVVSFVAYEVESLVRALGRAASRGTRIDMLLEASTGFGGKVTFDSVASMKKVVPTVNVYTWSAAPGESVGSVHAKCAVADHRIALVTSANLSTAAMERNMELGILVTGGPLPGNLQRHLAALVSTKIVQKV